MPAGRMNPIVRPYSAMAIQERERAISCKRGCIIAENQRMVLLICGDNTRVVH